MSSEQKHRMPSLRTSHDILTSSQEQPREMKLFITPSRKASTPPVSPPTPSPPPTPCPWLWRCHSCYTIYRLAVTRRCLDCDHTFCLGDVGGASPPKGKKRKRGGPCKAEFDYTGWKTRGAWRRTVLLNGDNSNVVGTGTTANKNQRKWGDEYKATTETLGDEARFEDKRDHLFLRKRHNCFLHCDFPSECHHALFRAQQEGRPILREAEALDAAEAAREAAEREGRRFTRRLTVKEYKQRRTARRRGSSGAGAAAVSSRSVEDLSTVDEASEEDNISPCSPTSPDPPGDLMREVSPVEYDGANDDDEQPLSPSGRRTSLLVTTDTPVDFATTAEPLSFDDTYSDDEDEYEDDDQPRAHEEQQQHQRRTKSRRKIAQLTGEGLESFGPFILDTSAPSPTSPSAGTTPGHAGTGNNHLPALDLQAAYSEQAWFSSSASASATSEQPLSPRSPERVGKRDRMLALLGRRSPVSPTRASLDVFGVPAREHQHQPARGDQPRRHADATEVAGEEWESWSDSSSSSSASTTSSTASGQDIVDYDTDADGDVPMRDAADSSPAKDVDEDMDSPVTPPGEHGAGAGGDEAENLRVLLRMRNAFMRGDMI